MPKKAARSSSSRSTPKRVAKKRASALSPVKSSFPPKAVNIKLSRSAIRILARCKDELCPYNLSHRGDDPIRGLLARGFLEGTEKPFHLTWGGQLIRALLVCSRHIPINQPSHEIPGVRLREAMTGGSFHLNVKKNFIPIFQTLSKARPLESYSNSELKVVSEMTNAGLLDFVDGRVQLTRPGWLIRALLVWMRSLALPKGDNGLNPQMTREFGKK